MSSLLTDTISSESRRLLGGEGEGFKSVIGRDTNKSLLPFAKKIDRNWV